MTAPARRAAQAHAKHKVTVMSDISRSGDSLSVRLLGGPTALIEYGGLRFPTDPTFDPPGAYGSRPGVKLTKQSGPALGPDELPAIDGCCSLTTITSTTSTIPAARSWR